MTKVAIIDTAPIAARNLFDFVLNKEINSGNIEAFSKSFAYEELKNQDKGVFSADLQSFSFYDISNYKYKEMQEEKFFELIVILSDFKSDLLNRLLGVKKINKNKGKLQRQVSPPLQAYQYIGNNKTDIKYSDKSFGLLFE